MVWQHISQLLTLTTACIDREATRVDREDAILISSLNNNNNNNNNNNKGVAVVLGGCFYHIMI